MPARQTKYLVTLTGFDSRPETIGGLKRIAAAVSARIDRKGAKPKITSLLPSIGSRNVIYIKGNLGLYNSYHFHTQNIFRVRSGVVGDYGDAKVFVFGYCDGQESRRVFLQATKQLKTEKGFTDIVHKKSILSMRDDQEHQLRLERVKNYIVISLGKKLGRVRELLNKTKTEIQSASD